MKEKRYFIITIDTEGDNLWGVSNINQEITTENAKSLFRFQELCEKYGFIPTYLINYEMACDQAMQELGRMGIKKGTLEIGAHEHAWNQPPYFPLIKRINRRGKPYLGEYPSKIIYKKLEYLTKTLEDSFGCEIKSHRGGRWYLDNEIVKCLGLLGYIVDCTCTPGVNWTNNPGWSWGWHGVDWSSYDNCVFELEANMSIKEIPVTIDKVSGHNRVSWLRPNGKNEIEMIQLLDQCSKKSNYVEFMIHSSELMAGGSPLFSCDWEINRLYEEIESVFGYATSLGYEGIGITEYSKML